MKRLAVLLAICASCCLARNQDFSVSTRACSWLVTAPQLPPGGSLSWQKGDVVDFDTTWIYLNGIEMKSTARRTVTDADAATVTVHVNIAESQLGLEQLVDAQVQRSDGSILSLLVNGVPVAPDPGGYHPVSDVPDTVEIPAGTFAVDHVTWASATERAEFWVQPGPQISLPLSLILTSSEGNPEFKLQFVRQYNRLRPTPFQPGQALTNEPLSPLPQAPSLDPRKVRLGEQLFEDVRLSAQNNGSCLMCHDPHAGGTDRIPTAYSGPPYPVGHLNTPGLFNVGFETAFFWDGRAKSLEDEIDGPVLAPNELGSTWDMVLGKLRADPQTVATFGKIYPDGIQVATIKDAIATYVRSFVTPDADFDHYLLGDDHAITDLQKTGYALFKSYGCVKCHGGALVGGEGFTRLKYAEKYLADRGNVVTEDYGRFNVTHLESDRYKFKTPALRNVWRTQPYFHDGTIATLPEAIQVMSQYEYGAPLPQNDEQAIEAFLRSLTGTYEGQPVR